MRGGLGAREQREQDAFHLHAAVHESLSGTFPTWPIELTMSVLGGKTDSQPTSWKRRE
jgi:hypothetical protein